MKRKRKYRRKKENDISSSNVIRLIFTFILLFLFDYENQRIKYVLGKEDDVNKQPTSKRD